MLILLSPAKNLNFDRTVEASTLTEPRLTKDTEQLIKRAKRLSRAKLRQLMDISKDLSDLNYHRFQALADGLPADDARPALTAFNGDVYRGLDAETLTEDDVAFAQDHLRILSGLYGLLRPLDVIHPYRLEMGTRLDTRRGDSLYDFWGDRISKLINEDLPAGDGPIVNLASNEYFTAVKKKALATGVIDVVLREEKDGKSRVISFYAKYARGLMARWIIQNRISDPSELSKFNLDGYQFDASGSTAQKLVFTRPQPDPKS